MWETKANKVEDIYDGFVDWEERFYLCPECGEPVYESDWDEEDFEQLCPICLFNEE